MQPQLDSMHLCPSSKASPCTQPPLIILHLQIHCSMGMAMCTTYTVLSTIMEPRTAAAAEATLMEATAVAGAGAEIALVTAGAMIGAEAGAVAGAGTGTLLLAALLLSAMSSCSP
mmetsp:Transcript_6/g.24  ORF Transcript_6/g.24 Transcript_6/m.24 type:complete len:115 (+) Transcript_6:264-608(+)